MSETSILPGAAPVDSGIGSTPPDGDGPESAGGDRRRQLMIAGAVIGGLLVILVAYLLLHGGSSSTPTAAAPGALQTAAPTAATGTTKHHTAATKTLPKVQKNPRVHNPFVPLVQPPTSGGTSTQVSSTTVTNASPSATPSSPVLTGPGATPQPSTQPTTPTTSAEPIGIELIKIQGDRAVFNVLYPHNKFRKYTVQAPKTGGSTLFDSKFALLGITGSTVTIQEGSGSPYDLQTGIIHSA